MTIEHDTVRQSTVPTVPMVPMVDDTVMRALNRPPLANGVASFWPYRGGFDEIHADAGLAPVMFTPPPQGDGGWLPSLRRHAKGDVNPDGPVIASASHGDRRSDRSKGGRWRDGENKARRRFNRLSGHTRESGIPRR